MCGVIFQNGFSPKAPSTRSPWLLRKIRGPIWRSKDHLVMKGLTQNVENLANLRFDNPVRPDPAAPGPRKLRTIFPHTSVLPKPFQLPYGTFFFPLGRILGFTSFYPIGPLFGLLLTPFAKLLHTHKNA